MRDEDFRRVVAALADAVVVADAADRVVFVNAALESLLGWTAKELVGGPLTAIMPERFRARHSAGLARFVATRAPRLVGRPVRVPALRRDGGEVDVELVLSVLDADAPAPVFVATLRDLRGRVELERERDDLRRELERARAETRARYLADAGALLGSSLDFEATLERVARLAVPNFADWCAVDVVDGARPDERTVAVAHVDPGRDAMAHALRARQPADPDAPHGVAYALKTGRAELLPEIPEEVLRAMARDAEHFDALRGLGLTSAMTVPLASQGRTFGAITFVSQREERRFDAEDLATAEELGRRAAMAIENARLYREARAAVRARDDFLSIASHELKTPLTTLLLQVQRSLRWLDADREVDRDRVRAALTAASRQVVRLMELIERLLDVTRVVGHRLDIAPETVDLASVAREVTGRFAEEAARAGSAVALHAPSPVVGRWDRLRLEQVATNLVANAIRYGAGRPIEVRVEGDPDGARARLVVRDEGVGIDAAQQARIFERFERATSIRNYGGLGLGLWITRQIVEAMGGSVAVESAPGRGATFVVDLPREPPPPRDSSTPREPARA